MAASPAARLSLAAARAFWYRRQGFDRPAEGASPAAIALRSGWLRTLGGVEAYLAARARLAGFSRAAFDADLRSRALQVLPAVRGCIYVVPREDAALAVAIAEEQYRPRNDRDMKKLGVTEAELEGLMAAAVEVLSKGPATTDGLRRAMPAGLVRSLGPEGKKLGVSSPLPTAIRYLEFAGRVSRTLEGGRVDSEKYLWVLNDSSPWTGSAVPSDPIDRLAQLAERFYAFAGPAPLEELAEWSGAGKRDVRAAITRAPLVPVAVEGWSDACFMREADLPALTDAAPAEPVVMLPMLDNYLALHGGAGPLADPRHHALPVKAWGSGGSTLEGTRHLLYRPVLVGPRVVGFWDWDPTAREVVLGLFDTAAAPARQALDTEAAALTRFIETELGHARMHSLDSDDKLLARANELRTIK